jgi:hypothetical protein
MHGLTETSLVRIQLGRFDDSIVLRTRTFCSQVFLGPKLAYDGIPVDRPMHSDQELQSKNT